MNTKTRRLWAPAWLLSLGLLAVTACGSEEEPAPVESSEEAGEEGEAEEVLISPEELSGLVLFHQFRSDVYLTFHDVDDGSLKSRIELSEFAGTDERVYNLQWHWFAFSPGFRHVAMETDTGLQFGTLDDETHTYTPTATVEPADGSTFGGGALKYQSAQFTPDGEQLWFTEHAEHGEGDSRVLAVDTSAPEGGEPEHVGDVPRDSVPRFRFESVSAYGRESASSPPASAYAITEENELDVLTLHEPEDESGGDDPEKGSELAFLAGDTSGVVPWNFLRGPDEQFIGPLAGDSWGNQHTQLSLFTMEPDGTVADDEVFLETEGNPISQYWYDSEGDRLLLRTSDAYYVQEIGSTSEPDRAFDDFDYGEEAEGGTPANSLGIYPPYPG